VLAHAGGELRAVRGADVHGEPELLARPDGGPFSPAPGSLGVVVVAAVVVDEAARSATPGELPPPLQPAANSANGTIETTQARMTGRRQRMSSGSFCMRQVDEQ